MERVIASIEIAGPPDDAFVPWFVCGPAAALEVDAVLLCCGCSARTDQHPNTWVHRTTLDGPRTHLSDHGRVGGMEAAASPWGWVFAFRCRGAGVGAGFRSGRARCIGGFQDLGGCLGWSVCLDAKLGKLCCDVPAQGVGENRLSRRRVLDCGDLSVVRGVEFQALKPVAGFLCSASVTGDVHDRERVHKRSRGGGREEVFPSNSE